MKTTRDVENIARLTAGKLGEGWGSEGTVLGAQISGPRGARIRMNLEGQLVRVYADNVPEDAQVPGGLFDADQNFIGWLVCNSIVPRLMRYLDDAQEDEAERVRWRGRTEAAITRLAQSAGVPSPSYFGGNEDRVEGSFLAHGCRVNVESTYQGEGVVRIAVPARLDLGRLSLDWNYEEAAA